jgi:cation diffusion facilitator CzcD-associated flavoprotein CzcO
MAQRTSRTSASGARLRLRRRRKSRTLTATRRRGPGAVVSHRSWACRRRYAWGRRGARSCRYSRSLLVDRLVGVGGRTLGEAWNRSPRAYLGTTVPGFPNFFILLGPNSIRINSVIFSLEAQIDYVMEALKTMEKSRAPHRDQPRSAGRLPRRL